MMASLLFAVVCLGFVSGSGLPAAHDPTEAPGGSSSLVTASSDGPRDAQRAGARLFGTLLGPEGAPLDFAQVHLQTYAGGEVLGSATADGDGRWSLDADSSGVFLLWFSAPLHRGERVGLLLTGDESSIEIDARLVRHELRRQPFEAALILSLIHI
jgi:hypothetical protein